PSVWVTRVDEGSRAVTVEYAIRRDADVEHRQLVLANTASVKAIADTVLLQALMSRSDKGPVVPPSVPVPAAIHPPGETRRLRLSLGSQIFVNPRRSDDNPAGLVGQFELLNNPSPLSVALELGYLTSSRRVAGVGDATTRALPVTFLLRANWRAGEPYVYGVGGGFGVVPLVLRYEEDSATDENEVLRRERTLLLGTRVEGFGGIEIGQGFILAATLGVLFHRNDARIEVDGGSSVAVWRSPMMLMGLFLRWTAP
ncbi:MAG: hypothetical protein AAFY60_22295, partial [Myxococcota bacterium]